MIASYPLLASRDFTQQQHSTVHQYGREKLGSQRSVGHSEETSSQSVAAACKRTALLTESQH